MADEVLTETDGDEDELIAVEVDDKGKPIIEEGEQLAEGGEVEHEDDEDDEDERLAEHEDEDDDPTKKRNREKRLRRREMQKRAREHQEAELARLAQANEALTQRLQALEGHTVTREQQSVEQQLRQAVYEYRQAEEIIAKATTAGNGDDVVAAMRIKDDALARVQQLNAQQEAFTQSRAQPQQAPQVHPQVASYGQEWMRANPWYKPNSSDEDSNIVDAIDRSMTAQGLDPTSRSYWEELTRRVAARIGTGDEDVNQRDEAPRRRSMPPTGQPREHASQRTRREVIVTPERKAAMQEAGVWDDPVARTRYLKAYQAYDKEHSAR